MRLKLIMIFLIFYCFSNAQEVVFEENNITQSYASVNTVYAIDINEDGFMDIVTCADATGDVSWWENDGNQSFEQHSITSSFVGARHITVADLNDDDYLDILGAAYSSNKICWWENDGNHNFNEVHIIDSTFIGAHTVDAKDVDGDGLLDILCSGFDLPGTEGDIAWWRNIGNEEFEYELISDRFDQSPFIFGEYINNDEYLDILACGESRGEVVWWENNANNGFICHPIDTTFTMAHTVFPRDLDLDGDMDILGAACMSSRFAWWENDGNMEFTRHDICTLPGALWIDAVDLDLDGDMDLIGCGQAENTVAWWENDGDLNFTKYPLEGYCPGAFGLIAEDMDRDNIPDIVSSSRSANILTWWKNDGIRAEFNASIIEGTAPLTVNFTDLTIKGNPIMWYWDLTGNGDYDSFDQNPEWTYQDPGIYNVSLWVHDGTYEDTELKEGYIIVTATPNDENVIYDNDVLDQNFPNPFIVERNSRTTTEIKYKVSEFGLVEVIISNFKGQKIKTLLNENKKPGNYSVFWDGKDEVNRKVASGYYFYTLRTNKKSITKKMLILK